MSGIQVYLPNLLTSIDDTCLSQSQGTIFEVPYKRLLRELYVLTCMHIEDNEILLMYSLHKHLIILTY